MPLAITIALANSVALAVFLDVVNFALFLMFLIMFLREKEIL